MEDELGMLLRQNERPHIIIVYRQCNSTEPPTTHQGKVCHTMILTQFTFCHLHLLVVGELLGIFLVDVRLWKKCKLLRYNER